MMNIESQNSVVTIAELCAELRISRTTAWRLIKSGEISSVCLGRRLVRVLRASVDDYVRRNERVTPMKGVK